MIDQDRLVAEMNDAVEYHRLAVEMDCKPIFLMARDEMTHAKWIHDYLHEHGIPIDSAVEERYTQYEKAHK